MQVQPHHIRAASHLVANADDYNLTPAGSGYLAAVDRLGSGGPTAGSHDFLDATGDSGSLYALPRPDVSQGRVLDAARVRLTLRGAPDPDTDEAVVVHAFTPDEARARAYELLVLADLAEVKP